VTDRAPNSREGDNRASDVTPRFVERVWYGRDSLASAMRAALLPFERIFGGVIGARELMYDAGWLSTHATALPAVSVGNLSVGGTGKTPIAAWVAHGLASRGLRPAIVLRGYGDDEPLVHKTLNPGIPVVVNADRVAGIEEAARGGADIAVLDDAFQHRRARRVADLVLVSADRWTGDARLLPAGPWREPLRAIRRASLIVVTRKAASDGQVDAVHTRLSEIAPLVPRVSVVLAPSELVCLAQGAGEDVAGAREVRPISALRGATIRVIAAIADPGAFVKQLESAGATVEASVFPDHHAFTAAEIASFVRSVAQNEWIVCTLKDAVKLGPQWPRLAPPLWYVSQRVMVERGVGGLEHMLDELAGVRSQTSNTAG
jgi:tetraacyldisaccharide 4'-kinase